jgi:hypothetical protein
MVTAMAVAGVLGIAAAGMAAEVSGRMKRVEKDVCALVALSFMCVVLAGPAFAEIPQKINYQGRLVDGVTGDPLVGPRGLIFRLYDAPMGGDTLWTESQTVSADSSGVFSCLLGARKPVTASFVGETWLEVEVDGEVLQPRRELASVPYAFIAREALDAVHATHASMADSLGGLDAGAFAEASHDHDDRYYTEAELNTGGTINQAGNPVDWSKLKGVPAGLADGIDDVGAGDGYSLDAADGDPTDAVYVDNAGNVGIGTSSPARKVHVVGEGPRVLLEASAGNPEVNLKLGGDNSAQVWALYKESTTGDLRFYQGGDRVTIKNSSGNVGIGTVNPTLGKLQVEDPTGTGVYAASNDGTGILGFSQNGSGVTGVSNNGHAGSFVGDVYVSGDLGVGVDEPTEKVDIDGNLRLRGYISMWGQPVFDVSISPEQLKVGFDAGVVSTGLSNTFVGNMSGYRNTVGYRNTFLGARAGQDNVEGGNNTFLGTEAGLSDSSGSMNTYVGEGAGALNRAGTENTFLGSRAGEMAATGSYNTFVGWGAGYGNEGSGNVFLGYRAGYAATGSNKLYIANGENASNMLICGDFSAGNVGIGMTAPERKLHIKGEGPRVLIEASSGNPEVNFKTAGDAAGEIWAIYKHSIAEDLRFYQNGDRVTIQNGTGNVGIGTTNPGTYKLYVNGEAYATLGWTPSDARLKTDLRPIGDALAKVLELKGLSFLWRTGEFPDRSLPGGRHYGLIAQDVEKVLPEVVKDGADGEKAVAYSELIPVLVESIKELKAETDELRAENTELRARLDALGTR